MRAKPIRLQPGGIQLWIGGLCLLLLCGAGGSSLRIGLSRAYSDYALLTAALPAADTAVWLNPVDAQAHYARAMALAEAHRFPETVAALERAIRLNPRDYYLWLKLGRAYDWQGRPQAAYQAFHRATQIAPHYAPPRWEFGNLLLREGAREKAFVELRRASVSNAKLLPAVIDLAWTAYAGEPAAVLQAVQPQTPAAQLTLARFFARQNQLAAALALLPTNDNGTAANPAAGNEAAETLRRRILIDLLDAQRFREAYQVWLTRPATEATEQQTYAQQGSALSNGGFEKPLVRDREIPFGWHWADELQETVKLALDPHLMRTGAFSLQIQWAGNAQLSTPVISQMVVVEPTCRYQLTFAARTQNLVTGGLPLIAVAEAQSAVSDWLGVSESLPRNSNGWQDYAVEFTTGPQTNAVRILLRRQCKTDTCPIYGQVWLDDFVLRKL